MIKSKPSSWFVIASLACTQISAWASGGPPQPPSSSSSSANSATTSPPPTGTTTPHISDLNDAVLAATWGWALVSTILFDLKTFNSATGTITTNAFVHQRYLSNYSSSVIVSPNYDTLYSSAVLNLRQEPLILHVPDTKGRYYVIPFHDLQTNAFDLVGSLTTGTQEGYVYITGPNYEAPNITALNTIHSKSGLPPFIAVVQAPGYDVFNIGRIRSNGPEDTSTVNALQDQLQYSPYRQHFNTTQLPSGTNNLPTPQILCF